MTRVKMDDRRYSVTRRLDHELAGGNTIHALVTFGFDRPKHVGGRVRELFCADFKTGSDNHALIMDACVLVSRLLQHGYTPRALADTLCAPPSLLGTMLLAAAEVDEEGRDG